jgi:cell division protein FtsI (penicillin-binding protein 3)
MALVLVGVWLAALGVRLYDLQVRKHDHYASIARRQQQDIVELEPPRGTIYDARGRELAVSVNAESLFANPADVENPVRVAGLLSEELGLSRADLERTLGSSRRFVWIQRKLDPPQAQRVRDLGIDGLGFIDESKRYYPSRRLAGHLLGFVGTDHVGLEGLERHYDSVIAGKAVRRTVLRDAYRQALNSPEHQFPDVEPGQDLHLTIDATIQQIVERELAAAVEASGGTGGSAIVLDPWSGAILAMTSLPYFDPNRFAESDAATRRIRSITDVFEPGSTFKMVTIAAAMEGNLIDSGDLIDCERGGITINRIRIRDHHPYAELTVREILAKSSNVGAIKIGLIAGPQRLDEQVRAFGFGRPTGVDLPGESGGLLRPREQWPPMADVFMSFGHGLAVTSLQLANSFAAVANGGTLYRPHIVRSIGDGEPRRPEALGRVLHPATARSVERLLEAVVETGTAKRAQVPGYRVAGKTGTPQKLSEDGRGYSNSRYMASFVGFAPARSPRVVCLVMIDEPSGGAEGGVVAAPTFSAIVRSVLTYLRVPPEDPAEPEWERLQKYADRPAPSEVDPPTVLSVAALEDEPPAEPVLPDLAGLTAREAVAALAESGLNPRIHGAGFVHRQRPLAGTPMSDIEDSIELWLGPSRS